MCREFFDSKTLGPYLKSVLDQAATVVKSLKSRPLKPLNFLKLSKPVVPRTEVRLLSKSRVFCREFEPKEERPIFT